MVDRTSRFKQQSEEEIKNILENNRQKYPVQDQEEYKAQLMEAQKREEQEISYQNQIIGLRDSGTFRVNLLSRLDEQKNILVNLGLSLEEQFTELNDNLKKMTEVLDKKTDKKLE